VDAWRSIAANDDRDGGITMIELIVSISIASILMALGMWAMRSYLISSREAGTADNIRSALRAAGEQAVSQGRTFCVFFTATTWTTYRSDCTVAANKTDGPNTVTDQSITLTSVSFVPPGTAVPGQSTACPTANKCAYFYPRGTSLAGSLVVNRSGKAYTISVEGLTSRVSLA
jgi:prepilin-type N-terminal cleavage/methylation domain-containing protein